MTGFADEMFQKLCARCIADFNGGFPDFCVEELKKRWAGEGTLPEMQCCPPDKHG